MYKRILMGFAIGILLFGGVYHFVIPRYEIVHNLEREMSIEELTAESDVIIIGTVNKGKTQWFERESIPYPDEKEKYIATVFTVQVARYIKGEGPDTIIVGQWGGQVGNHINSVEGDTFLSENEKVVLFLRKNTTFIDGKGYHLITSQGKFELEENRAINKRSALTTTTDNLINAVESYLGE